MDVQMLLKKDRYSFEDLLSVMRLLRSDCPWDKEQTHQSIRNNFLEEAYEAVEAIDNNDVALLKEELGDVLLQVVFHSRLSEEEGQFTMEEVIDGLCKKLIVRHPHIFSNTCAETTGEVLSNWDAIKKVQKGNKSTSAVMDSISKALPALVRAHKTQKVAAKVGFDFSDAREALKKVYEEYQEVSVALDSGICGNITEEIGDLLFSVVNVARLSGIDSEEALTRSTNKFYQRYKKVEERAIVNGVEMKRENIDSLNLLWEQVKREQ